jgi:hypothetical protein
VIVAAVAQIVALTESSSSSSLMCILRSCGRRSASLFISSSCMSSCSSAYLSSQHSSQHHRVRHNVHYHDSSHGTYSFVCCALLQQLVMCCATFASVSASFQKQQRSDRTAKAATATKSKSRRRMMYLIDFVCIQFNS